MYFKQTSAQCSGNGGGSGGNSDLSNTLVGFLIAQAAMAGRIRAARARSRVAKADGIILSPEDTEWPTPAVPSDEYPEWCTWCHLGPEEYGPKSKKVVRKEDANADSEWTKKGKTIKTQVQLDKGKISRQRLETKALLKKKRLSWFKRIKERRRKLKDLLKQNKRMSDGRAVARKGGGETLSYS